MLREARFDEMDHTLTVLYHSKYVVNSISKLQIQVATYVFELSAGNCHR